MAFRHHPITGDPIVFAPERAGRPNAFGREDAVVCPFCPGHESLTPPEIAHAGDPWRVRVFPNKYPAVDRHEIIVESNQHDATFDRIDNAVEVLSVCLDRYRAHADAAYVSLFKNEGERSGASIDHLHSQLMPLPMVPARVAREAAAFGAASSCPLCGPRENIIEENEGFLRFAPAGSQHPYEQWIIPKRHQPEIVSLTDDEVGRLATILQSAVRATRSIAAAHNILFMNFPRQRSAHFYIDLFPRLTSIAGFELATGMFIDIIDPAAAARRLR
jgi:UDPglucose--hexose-1-phosphate uridylyltransferase